MINEKMFYDLSLLSYFDYNEVGNSVMNMILSIKQDKHLEHDFDHRTDIACNIQMVDNIDETKYESMKIVYYYNDNAKSGLVYYVFEYEGVNIFAFRGSEPLDDVDHTTGWQDWMDNFRMFLKKPSYQQLLTLHLIQQMNLDKPFYMCGHSKGGNLALFCALTMRDDMEQRLKGVYSFNAPGITKVILSTYQQRAQDTMFLKKLTLFENENDTISSFFEHIKDPLYIKSSYPCTNMLQLYHNHNLYAMDFEDNLYLLAEKKTGMPKVVYHFVNDFFMNLKQERLEAIVHHMDDYFTSGLSLNELYKVMIYHISTYTSLFEDISYDEIQSITFQDLIERRKTKILTSKLKELQPKETITKMANELITKHSITKLNDIDVIEVTQGIINNYELLVKEKAKDLHHFVSENNERIIQSIKSIRNRQNSKEE